MDRGIRAGMAGLETLQVLLQPCLCHLRRPISAHASLFRGGCAPSVCTSFLHPKSRAFALHGNCQRPLVRLDHPSRTSRSPLALAGPCVTGSLNHE
nr:hypothetical protein CFP56_70393 [Quercus suber]